ncbi:hypothetical protein GGI21_006812, partial [Coemansia aciculifera]
MLADFPPPPLLPPDNMPDSSTEPQKPDVRRRLSSKRSSSTLGEPFVFEPSKDILRLSQQGGLSMVLQTALATLFTALVL